MPAEGVELAAALTPVPESPTSIQNTPLPSLPPSTPAAATAGWSPNLPRLNLLRILSPRRGGGAEDSNPAAVTRDETHAQTPSQHALPTSHLHPDHADDTLDASKSDKSPASDGSHKTPVSDRAAELADGGDGNGGEDGLGPLGMSPMAHARPRRRSGIGSIRDHFRPRSTVAEGSSIATGTLPPNSPRSPSTTSVAAGYGGRRRYSRRVAAPVESRLIPWGVAWRCARPSLRSCSRHDLLPEFADSLMGPGTLPASASATQDGARTVSFAFSAANTSSNPPEVMIAQVS